MEVIIFASPLGKVNEYIPPSPNDFFISFEFKERADFHDFEWSTLKYMLSFIRWSRPLVCERNSAKFWFKWNLSSQEITPIIAIHLNKWQFGRVAAYLVLNITLCSYERKTSASRRSTAKLSNLSCTGWLNWKSTRPCHHVKSFQLLKTKLMKYATLLAFL